MISKMVKNESNTLRKLLVENLGPIEHAEILLEDFTAIIGPNSSGKTYLTNILDRMLDYSNSLAFVISGYVFNAIGSLMLEKKDENIQTTFEGTKFSDSVIEEIIEYIIERADDILKDSVPPDVHHSYFNIAPLPSPLPEIFQYFQGEPKDLIKFGKDHAKILANMEQCGVEIEIWKDREPDVKISLHKDFLYNFIKGFKGTYSGVNGAGSFGSNYYIGGNQVLIPTERISVLVSLPNILDDLAKERGRQFILHRQAKLPQVSQTKQSLLEFLSNYLRALQDITANKVGFSDAASDLIMGQIVVDERLPTLIQYKIQGNILPLHLVSSGALQLIPLIILAESTSNDFLLIEEPEINLHANKQVEVAKYLWGIAVEKRKRLFLSTHSDYLLMQLAHLSAKSKDISLKVYLLNEGKTTPLNIDENGEIEEISTIGNVLNDLLLR